MNLLARFLAHRDRAHPDVIGVSYPVNAAEHASLIAALRAEGVHAWADDSGWLHARWGGEA